MYDVETTEPELAMPENGMTVIQAPFEVDIEVVNEDVVVASTLHAIVALHAVV